MEQGFCPLIWQNPCYFQFMHTTDQDLDRAREILHKAKAVLLDLDGTLYRGDRVFPGAPRWVSALKSAGKKVFFLSNNTSRSTREYLPKLYDLGFDISPGEIWGALNASLDYLRTEGLRRLLVIGTDAVRDEFKRAGFALVDENPDAVVLTYDTTFDYQKFVKAHKALLGGARFIATHPDLLCPTEDGFVPDIGCLIAAFQTAGHAEPLIIGKPSATMVKPLLRKFDLRPDECVVVGDRLYTDIRMGVENGLGSLLVLTGESRLPDLEQSPWQPTAVVESVGHLLA